MTGRLLACEVARSKMRVSVIGPIGDDVRDALGAETENDKEFKLKKVPGGLLLTFPIEHAVEAIDLLKDGLNGFVDVAMARVRSSVNLEDHVPEAVAYIASVVGRELPQPKPVTETQESEQLDNASDEDDAGASHEPRVAGAPIFEHGQRSIASLMSDIGREVIALPDLQRPFVWEDTKVRDLLDSRDNLNEHEVVLLKSAMCGLIAYRFSNLDYKIVSPKRQYISACSPGGANVLIWIKSSSASFWPHDYEHVWFQGKYPTARSPSVRIRCRAVAEVCEEAERKKKVLERANGHCEYCGEEGFLMGNGERYLEVHHVVALWGPASRLFRRLPRCGSQCG